MKYDANPKRQCTLPKILGLRKWFENRFGDLCEVHDYMYVNKFGKWNADKAFLKGMYNRGYWWMVPPTFFFFMTLGFAYYYLID